MDIDMVEEEYCSHLSKSLCIYDLPYPLAADSRMLMMAKA